jgi:hypothetical protein
MYVITWKDHTVAGIICTSARQRLPGHVGSGPSVGCSETTKRMYRLYHTASQHLNATFYIPTLSRAYRFNIIRGEQEKTKAYGDRVEEHDYIKIAGQQQDPY